MKKAIIGITSIYLAGKALKAAAKVGFVTGMIYVDYLMEKESTSQRRRRTSYTSYSDVYKNSKTGTGTTLISEVVFDTRGEAKQVWSKITDLIMEYGHATTADYCDLVGIPSYHGSDSIGWTDITYCPITHAQRGYILNLPSTKILNKNKKEDRTDER